MNSDNNVKNNIKLTSEPKKVEEKKDQVTKNTSNEEIISNIISNNEIISSLFNDHEIINN